MMHNSSDNNLEKDLSLRVLIIGVIAFTVLMTLMFRVTYIQVFKNRNYSERSKRTRESITRFPPIRGRIFSSDGKVLANNVKSYDLVIDPRLLSKDNLLRQQELLYVSKVVGIDYPDLEQMLQKVSKKREKLVLAENIPFNDFVKISENLDKLPGIEMPESLIRNYPEKKRLSHAIGYIGHIDYDEFSKLKEKGYKSQDWVGKTGIELSYEDVLRGEEGFIAYEIDAKMNVNKENIARSKPSTPGDDLILTIDMEFQKNVEDILADRKGGVVVLRPTTGEILAMASFPNFDPNIYILQTEENSNKKRELALDTQGTPLINRTLQSEYPPGSTFKMIPAAIVLEEDTVPISKTFYCNRAFRLGNERFGCWNFHAWQDLNEALTNSCDIYFYNTSIMFGIEKLTRYSMSFGLGRGTGIDIPFEKNGFIPSIEAAAKQGVNWYGGLTLISSIGQGEVKTTLVQLADYISVIANQGKSYRPHIVKEIVDGQSGEVKQRIVPELLTQVPYSKSTFQFLTHSMREVVKTGTAAKAFARLPLEFAGKTGTAEVGFGAKKQTHSLFTGFGPLNFPAKEQIVVVVLIEYENGHPLKYAGNVAAMVVNSWFYKEDFHTTAKKLWYPIRDSYND